MKQIITNKAVVFDASTPSETSIILFKDIKTQYNVNDDTLTFYANAYKVINDEDEDYFPIKPLTRQLSKEESDALYASLTITSTIYTERMDEELVKGLAYVINDENIFGLVTADLILR